jgi:hypothetical protein
VDRRIIGLVAAILVFGGCSGIDHGDIEGTTDVPDNYSSLSSASGQMRTGIAIAFTPHVWTRNTCGGTSEQSSDIGVQTSNAQVLHVAQVTDQKNQFVVWAVAPGNARVIIQYQGETAMSIPVTVTDPPKM